MSRFALRIAITTAVFAIAQPAYAAQVTAVTSVNVVKPVTISKLQDLDYGTLTFNSFTGTRTAVLSRAGALTCPADIVCSGTPRAAGFNIRGTNRLVVLISVTGGTMSNGVDSIPFTPDAPSSVTLTSSGIPGNDFYVGGSISVSPTLVGGTYTGTMTVTADYQ